MPRMAAMSMSGRESRGVVAEIVSGIDVPRLDRPGEVRPHAYQIGPIVAADNRSEHRGDHQRACRRARGSLTPQSSFISQRLAGWSGCDGEPCQPWLCLLKVIFL